MNNKWQQNIIMIQNDSKRVHKWSIYFKDLHTLAGNIYEQKVKERDTKESSDNLVVSRLFILVILWCMYVSV